MPTIDIAKLSAEEREELSDSLSATPGAIPLTDAQREELDQRLDELDRDGPAGIPWEEVLGRIRSRKP
jgi:putative addiction module component (TIGR02574 family)